MERDQHVCCRWMHDCGGHDLLYACGTVGEVLKITLVCGNKRLSNSRNMVKPYIADSQFLLKSH